WREAATAPLCLLTPEMHNRAIIDGAFRAAGATVKPAIETNAIVTVVLSVLDSDVCAVLPGALMALASGYRGLELRPLREPDVRTPIGFIYSPVNRPSRALDAALRLARDPTWLRYAQTHGGSLAS